jgi:hypothetical protein
MTYGWMSEVIYKTKSHINVYVFILTFQLQPRFEQKTNKIERGISLGHSMS